MDTISMIFISARDIHRHGCDRRQTQLGKVRDCPEELGQTLAVYTRDSGSHVHLQVLEEPVN